MEGFTIEQLNKGIIVPDIVDRVPRWQKILSPRNLWVSAIILGLVFVILIILFGGNSFSAEKVVLDIEALREISAGEQVTYKVIYTNNNDIGLRNVSLFFSYPSAAIAVVDGQIANISNKTVEIGDIGPGQSGEATFEAIIVGDRGNIKTAKAVLRFEPANLRSEFQREITHPTNITSLAVPIDLVAPPNVVSGQDIQYIIDYRNQSDQDFSGLRLLVRYPDGFTLSKTFPEPDGKSEETYINENSWDIETLRDGEGDRITIDGTISGAKGESKMVAVILQRKTKTTDGEKYVDFERAEATSVISSPPLSIDIKHLESDTATLHLGDGATFDIAFRNEGNFDITGITLSAKIEGNMFNVSKIETEGFFDSRTNTIYWDSSANSQLANLGTNQSGKVSFSVPVKEQFSGGVGIGTEDTLVNVLVTIESKNVPLDYGLSRIFSSDEMIVKISTDPSFGGSVYVVDPIWGATGPLPPKVDQKSVYTIKWTVTNPASDLDSAAVEAVLEPGVQWVGIFRGSNGLQAPVYIERERKVRWELGRVKAGIGDVFPAAEGYFQVYVIPSSNQIGDYIDLIGKATFTGIDTYTSENISRIVYGLDTQQIADKTGPERGIVEP